MANRFPPSHAGCKIWIGVNTRFRCCVRIGIQHTEGIFGRQRLWI